MPTYKDLLNNVQKETGWTEPEVAKPYSTVIKYQRIKEEDVELSSWVDIVNMHGKPIQRNVGNVK